MFLKPLAGKPLNLPEIRWNDTLFILPVQFVCGHSFCHNPFIGFSCLCFIFSVVSFECRQKSLSCHTILGKNTRHFISGPAGKKLQFQAFFKKTVHLYCQPSVHAGYSFYSSINPRALSFSCKKFFAENPSAGNDYQRNMHYCGQEKPAG